MGSSKRSPAVSSGLGGSKRAKTDPEAIAPAAIPAGNVIGDFLAWCAAHGASIEPSAISLEAGAAGCSGLALRAVAARDLVAGDVLATVPKRALLSPATTSARKALRRRRLGGGLALVIAVMWERRRGSSSPWHGYLSSLPRHEPLPLFWGERTRALLEGTDLEDRVEEDESLMREDFVEHVARFPRPKDAADRSPWTLQEFEDAASLVGSRSFGVDEVHGDAMVPIADIFNHKVSVVELSPAYEVFGEGDEEEEEEEKEEEEEEEEVGEEAEGAEEDGEEGEKGDAEQGEDGEEEDDADEEEEEEDDDDEDDDDEEEEEASEPESEGEPAPDAIPLGVSEAGRAAEAAGDDDDDDGDAQPDSPRELTSTSRVLRVKRAAPQHADSSSSLPLPLPSAAPVSLYGHSSANGLPLALQIGIVDADDVDVDAETDGSGKRLPRRLRGALRIVAASPIPAGAEVHNTYGELSNAQLAMKYGFAVRENPLDTVEIGSAELKRAGRKLLGGKAFAERASFLQRETEILDDGADEPELLELRPGGRLGPALFVALRTLSAPKQAFDAWKDVPDACTVDGKVQDVGVVPVVWREAEADERANEAEKNAGDAVETESKARDADRDGDEDAPADARAVDPSATPAARALSSLVDAPLLALLKAAVLLRVERLDGDDEDERVHKARAEQARVGALDALDRPMTDDEAAERTALLVRASERNLLREALQAIEERENILRD